MADGSRPGRPVRWSCLAVASILLAAAETRADLMRYEFSGPILNDVTGAKLGPRFSGTFSYDPSELPSRVRSAGWKFYQFGQPYGSAGTPDSDELTAAIDGKPVASEHGGLSLLSIGPGSFNGETPTKTVIRISNWDDTGPAPPYLVEIAFANNDHFVYPTLDPPSLLKLSDFTTGVFEVSASPTGPYIYYGQVDTLTPIPTPEPSAAILLGAVAAACLVRSRCRRA